GLFKIYKNIAPRTTIAIIVRINIELLGCSSDISFEFFLIFITLSKLRGPESFLIGKEGHTISDSGGCCYN
ncbi:MAG TPA: hypothetical protein VFC43_04330, partial [Methanoregula sp.]|nr:hypothetical protein [Methanoregula sp.]